MASGDDEHPRPAGPGELQGRVQPIPWTGEHHDSADVGRHSLNRPYEQARGSPADDEDHEHDDHEHQPEPV